MFVKYRCKMAFTVKLWRPAGRHYRRGKNRSRAFPWIEAVIFGNPRTFLAWPFIIHDHETNCLLQEISHVLKSASIKFGHPSIVWTCSSLLSFEKWINIIEVHFVCGNCILIYFALNFMLCEYVCYTPLYKHSVLFKSNCISYWVDYSNNITHNCFRTSYVLLRCF